MTTTWPRHRSGAPASPKVEGLPEEFRFHDFRHYLASLLIGSGLDVKVVPHRLRPGSAKTTWTPMAICGRTATSPLEPPWVQCWRLVRSGNLKLHKSAAQRRVAVRCRNTWRT